LERLTSATPKGGRWVKDDLEVGNLAGHD
jgi:hypothetical protein